MKVRKIEQSPELDKIRTIIEQTINGSEVQVYAYALVIQDPNNEEAVLSTVVLNPDAPFTPLGLLETIKEDVEEAIEKRVS